MKNKKGFTIIELIVVIAILGILVLLAAPRFMGYTEKATLRNIQNDVKVAENIVQAELVSGDSKEFIGRYELETTSSGDVIYNEKGLYKEALGGDLYDVSEVVNSKLDGSFLSDINGEVYYVEKGSEENPEQEAPKYDWHYYTSGEMYKGRARTMGSKAVIDPNNVSFSDGFIGEQDNSSIAIQINREHGESTTAVEDRDKRTGIAGIQKAVPYGSYESRIKVPEQAGLLNGFFLYGEQNGKSNEIDMEMMSIDGEWQLWLTIHNEANADYVLGEYLEDYDPNIIYSADGDENYAEPGVVYQKKINFSDLGIDPTAGYVNYKINYYKNNISFEINNQEVGKFTKDFDYMELELMTSTFWAHWLDKERFYEDDDGVSTPKETWYEEMNIEWIRKAESK